jgi:hypothetical protein
MDGTSDEFRFRPVAGTDATVPQFTGFVSDNDEIASFNLTATSWTAIASLTVTAQRSGFCYVWCGFVGNPAGNNNPDLRIRNTTTATDEWTNSNLQYTAADVLPSGIVTRVALNSGSNTIEFQGQVSGSQFDLEDIRFFVLGMW